MKPSDFFTEEEDPAWDLHGRDPWNWTKSIFNGQLVEQLRRTPQDSIDDVDAAYGLAKLAHEELVEYGTHNNHLRLNDEEVMIVLRSLRSVLNHLCQLVSRDLSVRHCEASAKNQRRRVITTLCRPSSSSSYY